MFGAQGSVVTGSIPTPVSATGVVAAFVAFTPTTSGKASIQASIVPGQNQNTAAQALNSKLYYTTTLPTIGSAPVAPTLIGLSEPVYASGTAADTGGNGCVPVQTLTSTVTGLTLNTTYYICVTIAQSAAGAYATLADTANGIRVTETPNG